MTETGSQFLAEYVSEIKEKIEDDKNKLITNQVFNFISGSWRVIYLNISLFVTGFAILLIASVFFIDSETIDLLRTASNEDLLGYISTMKTVAYSVSFVALIFIIANSTSRYFRNVKQERLDLEQKELDLYTLIVTIQDELLMRHNLVSKGYNENA